MSGSHDKLPTIFWVQIVLVLLVGTKYLITPAAPKHHGAETVEHEANAETKTALKSVGEVAVKAETGAAGGASRSGEDIVKKTCAVCHIAGVANAPKLDASAKDAWTKRMDAEKGLDGLVASAKKGKNGMPPNGADPSLNDEELKAAIITMLKQAGIEVATTESAPTKVEEKAVPVESKKTEVTEQPAPTEEKVTGNSVAAKPVAEDKSATEAEAVKQPSSPTEPTAPKSEVAPAAPKAATMPAVEVPVAPTAPKVDVMPAVEAKAPEPTSAPVVEATTEPAPVTEDTKPAIATSEVPAAPKAEAKPTTPVAPTSPKAEEVKSVPNEEAAVAPKVEEAKPTTTPVVPTTPKAKEVKSVPNEEAVVAPKVEEAKPTTPVTPTTPKAEKVKPTATVTPTTPKVEEAKSVAVVNEAATIDLDAGEKIYKSGCFACHDMAVANAPKPGDKAAWAARIAKGMEALYSTALKGDVTMPAMPAKGGNPTLSDSDVKNAVSYMVELSK